MTARSMCDGREVKEEIRGAAERRVYDHRILDCLIRQDIARGQPPYSKRHDCARRSTAELSPDLLARGRECRVRQREPKTLGDHLRGARRPEELTAAARRCAGAAARPRGVVERDLIICIAHAEGLHRAQILAVRRRERRPTGDENDGAIVHPRECHHHRG